MKQINSADWPALCQRITEQRNGAMVKVEIIGPDGIKTERVAGAMLLGMVFDKTGGCNDLITLRFGNAHNGIHEIVEPIQIKLQPSGTGDYNPLQIEAESGVTFITFNPAIHAQMLEGLKTS